MQTKRRVTTVAILGPFGWGNLGDAAIQDAVLAQLGSRRPDICIVGISLVPADTRERHGIETYAYDTNAFEFSRQDTRSEKGAVIETTSDGAPELPAFLRRVKEAVSWRVARLRRVVYETVHAVYVVRKLAKIDLLLVSGGGQLDEFWGGAWRHPFTLFKWAALAKLTRTRVAFISVGAGSVTSPLSRWFLRQALRLAQYRSYRDIGSKEIVRDCLGIDLDDPVVPDMAFALPVSPLLSASSGSARRLVVAVGPMPYCHPQSWPIRDSVAYERYVTVLSDFCNGLLLNEITLQFIVGEVRHDPPIVQDVLERLASQYRDSSSPRVVVPHIRSVDDLISCLSDADIVVASRFHGVLLALLLRRPVLALSYERKVRQLMTDLGQSEFCLDIEQASVGYLSAKFSEIQARRQSISRELDLRVTRETSAVLAQFDWVVSMLLPRSVGGRRNTRDGV